MGIGLILVIQIPLLHQLVFRDRIFPHLLAGGVDLTGKTSDEAARLLEESLGSGPRFKLTYGEREFLVDGFDIDLNYDFKVTANQAYLIGRNQTWLPNLRTRGQIFFRPQSLPLAINYSPVKLNLLVEKISQEVETPHQNAAFRPQGEILVVVPEITGVRVDAEELKKIILNTFIAGNLESQAVPSEEFIPAITATDLDPLKGEIEKIVRRPPHFSDGKKTWSISTDQALTMISFYPSTEGVTYTANEAVIVPYLQKIADEVNTPPKAEVFEVDEEGKVTKFALPKPGLEVNESEAVKVLAQHLLNPDLPREITLPLSQNQIFSQENEYGIEELLGKGGSKFAGSSAGRNNNIKIASDRLHGVLIPPGEVFSINKTLGEISAETGYSEAYIIEKGRTVLGTGGGVCQVSTTLFRAALNAGLEIVERTPHAYRVYYYEQGSPVGLDATVFNPTVDLKFKNDTPKHILVTTDFNPQTNQLVFSLYGTDDGRQTIVRSPEIKNEIPPPEPLRQEDNTLPKGEIKQVDWAAWGASVSVKRLVTRAGRILHEDTFYSNYRPWQAIYLVGTKED